MADNNYTSVLAEDEKISKSLSALANPIRLRILRNLYEIENTSVKLNSQDSVSPHKLLRSSISHHINILDYFGLVTKEKKGREVFLSITGRGRDLLVWLLEMN